VAWEDYRDGTCSYDECLDGDDYANRVRPSGQVLDGSGFPVSHTARVSEFRADAAWGGQVFLVGWEAYPDSRCQSFQCSNGDVRGARVSSAGVVIDTHPLDLAPGTSAETSPDVTTGPSARFALIYERRGDAGIHGGARRAFMRLL